MNILVTGGAGFIGSNFIRYWLEKHPKNKIINLDKLTYAGNLETTKDYQHKKNYRFIYGDICNNELVNKIMEGIDTVVHFAAESHVDRSIENPNIFIETNILGTHTLLDAAKRHGVKRFHHISTDEVYGELELGSGKKFTENTPYDPKSPYSASKAASDHLVRSYYYTHNLPITITNCSNNYGPYQSPEKFIPRSITNLINNKPIKIYGDGKYVRDWLHVKDHCKAIEKVIEGGKEGETYLIGGQSKKDISNKEIAETLLKIMGKGKDMIEYVTDRPGHDRRYAVDWSKIRKELKWKPERNFEKGLKETVLWYTENTWFWKNSKKEAENFYEKIGR